MRVNKELQFALRRSEGRKDLPDYLDNLSRALGRAQDTIHLLDLQPTDEFKEMFEAKLARCQNAQEECLWKRWSSERVDEMIGFLSVLRERVGNEPMILLMPSSEFCGAVTTTAREIFDRVSFLIDASQEELIALNSDGSFGFVLGKDIDKDEGGDDEVFELILWGITT